MTLNQSIVKLMIKSVLSNNTDKYKEIVNHLNKNLGESVCNCYKKAVITKILKINSKA